ncbi:MAG: MBL fold metallo-hydrolase [Burkholderiales bacterium]|jgi:glyoxylase-like metal-dependent hydrolase (beta-lactamase superfamily II)|nr:MBL fold metallo-hydrolase [Burkholderiales bacterium]
MSMHASTLLPPDIRVFERGWLSSNNILLDDGNTAVLVDTGYCTHADQTLALVAHALGDRPLTQVLNTHLHSDHCGGNGALQARYPAMQTAIPPGGSAAVAAWDEDALEHAYFGQRIARFTFDRLLQAASTETLAGRPWQVHAAPGHDPNAVLLFQPDTRTLISGDALWENGFGVVFPELAGQSGFPDVAATLDLIESLAPAVVIPGHGAVFADVAGALGRARTRLGSFQQSPQRHLRHAAKVLLKYKLLEMGTTTQASFHAWTQTTPALQALHRASANADTGFAAWVDDMLADLVRAGAARIDNGVVFNT